MKRLISFIIACLFLAYNMTLQGAPGVMANQLMLDLRLDPAKLGLLSGLFYYGMAPMQIPAGLLYDRFSTKYTSTIGLLLCALGTLLFATHHPSFIAHGIGRFIMGIGSSFAFILVLTLAAYDFPKRFYTLLCSIGQVMCALGAAFGLKPLALMLQHHKWQMLLTGLGLFGFGLMLAAACCIKHHKNKKTKQLNFQIASKTLATLVKQKMTWILVAFVFFNWGPILIFSDLWGVTFLAKAYQLTISQSAELVTYSWIGVMIGALSYGIITSQYQIRITLLRIASGFGLLSTTLILYLKITSILVLKILLVLFGAACSAQILIFPLAVEINAFHHISTVIAVINTAEVIGGTIFQPLLGYLIEIASHHYYQNLNQYLLIDFQKALIIIPLCFVVNLFISIIYLNKKYN